MLSFDLTRAFKNFMYFEIIYYDSFPYILIKKKKIKKFLISPGRASIHKKKLK